MEFRIWDRRNSDINRRVRAEIKPVSRYDRVILIRDGCTGSRLCAAEVTFIRMSDNAEIEIHLTSEEIKFMIGELERAQIRWERGISDY